MEGCLTKAETERYVSTERIVTLHTRHKSLADELSFRPESEEGLAAYRALDAAFEAAILAEAKYLLSIL
jgi:hypothetical protein